MNDPRLNSLHLPSPRRQDYRLAREVLLQAQGYHTLCAVRDQEHAGPSHTKNDVAAPSAPDCACWLTDRNGVYPLKVGVNTVGRSPENDVVVEDGYVSRRHCALLVHVHKGCEVHDTASKNGTYVNGARIEGPRPLHSGDEIRMCDRHFVFQCRDDLGGPATLAE
jgi:hypothetical protein